MTANVDLVGHHRLAQAIRFLDATGQRDAQTIGDVCLQFNLSVPDCLALHRYFGLTTDGAASRCHHDHI